MKAFSTRDMARETGVPVSTLNGWVRAGWLRPSLRAPVKQGSRSEWSAGDLEVVRQFKDALALAGRLGEVAALVRGTAGTVVLGARRAVVVAADDTVQTAMRRAGAPCLLIARPAERPAS